MGSFGTVQGMILSPEDLRELTDKRRVDAQARELRHMGIPYRKRTDGTLVVLEADVHGTPAQKQPPPPALRLP